MGLLLTNHSYHIFAKALQRREQRQTEVQQTHALEDNIILSCKAEDILRYHREAPCSMVADDERITNSSKISDK